MPTKLRCGYYTTIYGNTAVYRGGKTAYDLDMAEHIPVDMLDTWLRPLED